jgi:hypothetical protein
MNPITSSNLRQLLHSTAVAIVGATLALVLMGQRPILREQYQVINVNAGQNPALLQTQLNELGDQGWKVRTSVGNWVILAADR